MFHDHLYVDEMMVNNLLERNRLDFVSSCRPYVNIMGIATFFILQKRSNLTKIYYSFGHENSSKYVVQDPASQVVYFDNFFLTHNLLYVLRMHGFRATGTVRDNKTGHKTFRKGI